MDSAGKTAWRRHKKIQDLIDKRRKTLADVEYLDLNLVAKILKSDDYVKFSDENLSQDQKNM